MNKLTLEYECDGLQYMAVANFESCRLYTEPDIAYATGGKDNAKLISFLTSQHLKIDLINPSNISARSAPIEKEEVEIDYIVVPEKPKKKRRRKKKKKRKFDNGRKTN